MLCQELIDILEEQDFVLYPTLRYFHDVNRKDSDCLFSNVPDWVYFPLLIRLIEDKHSAEKKFFCDDINLLSCDDYDTFKANAWSESKQNPPIAFTMQCGPDGSKRDFVGLGLLSGKGMVFVKHPNSEDVEKGVLEAAMRQGAEINDRLLVLNNQEHQPSDSERWAMFSKSNSSDEPWMLAAVLCKDDVDGYQKAHANFRFKYKNG